VHIKQKEFNYEKNLVGYFLIYGSAILNSPRTVHFKQILVPAKITELDWILFGLEVKGFTGEIKYDDYGLIQRPFLTSTYVQDKLYVAVLFLVDNSRYIQLEEHVIKKIFLQTLESTAELVKSRIPKLKLETDVVANFMISGKRIIAEYINGDFKFNE